MVDHLSYEQKQEFEEAFDLYDRDYSGTISKKELGSVLRTLGQHPSEEGGDTCMFIMDLFCVKRI